MNKEEGIKNPREVELQERDLMTLQWVCEQGAVTVSQLCRAIWDPSGQSSHAYPKRRLQILEEAGLLESVKPSKTAFRYLTPTVRARKALQNYRGVRFPDSVPHLREFPHVEAITELRIQIQKAGALRSWESDRMLAQSGLFPAALNRDHIPDALWVNPPGFRIFLEYERTRKGPSRLSQKLTAYSLEMAGPTPYMDHVLWIADGKAHEDLSRLIFDSAQFTLRTTEEFLNELKEKCDE